MPEEFEKGSERFEDPPAFFPDDGTASEPDGENALIECAVENIYRTTGAGQLSHYVVLTDDLRKLYIAIGPAEAASIHSVLTGTGADRPGTHDLTKTLVERLGGTLDRITIDDFWNGVFYAKIFLVVDGEEIEVDARPSDAVALAARFECPIYVADALLDMVPEA